ncbi:MAG: hypothetical protein WBX03_09845 [Terriglobales bacterium]
MKSFGEFLERRFPESRRKAYYLMSIHEHLPPQVRRELKEVGWTKGLELAKVARRVRQHFDCATWLHKAREMPKEQFKREVEKELTGKESEPSEIIYFKLYKSQIPVIEQAIETAALMLGTDQSRGYCLEMICAGFLAGANLENGDSQVLLQSILRFFKFLPGEQRKTFLNHFAEMASLFAPDQSDRACCLTPPCTNNSATIYSAAMAGDAKLVARCLSLRFTTGNFVATPATIRSRT